MALAIVGCYSNSLSAPFVFDDVASIQFNPTIRHLWPPAAALSPPAGGRTVSGRPVLNFSFALNYASGRLDVRGYHGFNLVGHVLAAWTLFGLARRTLAKTPLGAPPERARCLGFAIALIWALHPLQTGAVTYVVQRAESLMGLFFLLTLYCFVRGAEAQGHEPAARRAGIWYALAIAACLLGAATKEVMVSAPIIVLLYDRAFLAVSVFGALRRRPFAYAGLFLSWLPLVWLVLSNRDRGATAGLGMGGTAAVNYLRVQFGAVLHYLRLAAWPHPLVFDYGGNVSGSGWILPAAGIVLLLALSIYCLWRRPAVGFLGAWFFAILAPSSSFVPVATEPMAEHRMYLPLAAVIAAGVCGIHALGLAQRRAGAWGLLVLALGFGGVTFARNGDYRSELTLWRDTVAKRPENFSARHNLALAFEAAGDVPAAMAEYRAALQLEPDSAKTRNNFGKLLQRSGQRTEAASEFRAALRIEPDNAEAHNNLGVTLALEGSVNAALLEFERALALKPDYVEAHNNRGLALRVLGREREAAEEFDQAKRFRALSAP